MNAAKLLLPGLLACSLASCWIAASSGIADLKSMATRARLVELNQRGEFPGSQEWADSNKAIAAALAWSADPVLLEQQAYLYELRAAQVADYPPVALALREKAQKALESALALRPMAPRAWSRLAVLRAKTGQGDDKFLQAYDSAWQYGVREHSIKLDLAQAGYARWQQLGAARQNELRRLLAGLPPEIAEQARRDANAVASQRQDD